MRFSPTGKSLLGIGGATNNVSVDGVVPAALATLAGGSWGWLTDDIIAGPGDLGAGYLLRQYTISTVTLTTLDPGVGDVSAFGAGSAVWAAFYPGGGTRTSIAGAGPYPTSGLADVSPAGDIGLISVYAADRGVSVYTSSGNQTANRDVVLTRPSDVRIRTGIVAFCTAGGWNLMTTAGVSVGYAPRTDVSVVRIIPCQVNGTVWVLEWATGDTLTFRPATAAVGFTIASGVNDIFNPDVMSLSAGVVRIGWSTTTGESPASLRRLDLTLATGTTVFGTTIGGSLTTSMGPLLIAATFPVGAVTGGAGQGLLKTLAALYQHPLVEPSRLVTAIWYKSFFQQIAKALTTPVNLQTQATGILPPAQGGTGTDTGTSVINGDNITLGTVPQAAKWREYTFTGAGTQNNVFYNAADFVRLANPGPLSLTGLVAGVPGQRLVLVVSGSDSVTLVYQSGLSLAANRLLTVDGADITLEQNDAAFLEYDGTDSYWRILFVSVAAETVDSNWVPLVDGAEPPAFITDGAGVLVMVTFEP